ncbi:MAG: hypothetical protein K0S74_1808 [Chlamydiales bacterium]|jgi:hypothetical protein|nr:hypothetical protein [Chlamydiales bacterium]
MNVLPDIKKLKIENDLGTKQPCINELLPKEILAHIL